LGRSALVSLPAAKAAAIVKIRRIDFSPGDWIGGTLGMSLEEEGLYIRLVARTYSLGESLDNDPTALAKLCQVRPQVMRRLLDRLKLMGKFHETGGKLVSNRCETEMKLAQNRLEQARFNGSKGGRPNGLAEPDGYQSVKPTSTITTNINDRSPRGDLISKPNGLEAKPRISKKRKAFPPDWQPDERDVTYAKEHGRDMAWIAAAAEHCRDHHNSLGHVFADLHAAWRTWVLKAPEFERSTNGKRPVQVELPNGLASTSDEAWRRRLSDFVKSKFWISNWGFPPDDPDCYAPAALLVEFGFAKVDDHAVS
jgi:uncharacterized protein YdaU (DUF1376 family)